MKAQDRKDRNSYLDNLAAEVSLQYEKNGFVPSLVLLGKMYGKSEGGERKVKHKVSPDMSYNGACAVTTESKVELHTQFF